MALGDQTAQHRTLLALGGARAHFGRRLLKAEGEGKQTIAWPVRSRGCQDARDAEHPAHAADRAGS